MKPRLLLGCLLSLLAGVLMLGAQEPGPELRLRGIVGLSTNQLALLEVPALPGWRGQMLLA
ncbi:MAG TPA: hypothetical protein VNZ22_08915, partial [Bacillota bacterium]|nr:hypothetical protein [Bacillota bacterium]